MQVGRSCRFSDIFPGLEGQWCPSRTSQAGSEGKLGPGRRGNPKRSRHSGRNSLLFARGRRLLLSVAELASELSYLTGSPPSVLVEWCDRDLKKKYPRHQAFRNISKNKASPAGTISIPSKNAMHSEETSREWLEGLAPPPPRSPRGLNAILRVYGVNVILGGGGLTMATKRIAGQF